MNLDAYACALDARLRAHELEAARNYAAEVAEALGENADAFDRTAAPDFLP